MSTTTLHKARKTRDCGGYRCERQIEAGQLYVRHVAFPGDEGCEEITQPLTMEECVTCADRGGNWVRSYYGVPAAVGGRIVFPHDGRSGTIITLVGGCLNVTFDGGRGTTPLHPTDVTYLDADGHAIPLEEQQPIETLNVDLGAVV
jgi:hypothetical protein